MEKREPEYKVVRNKGSKQAERKEYMQMEGKRLEDDQTNSSDRQSKGSRKRIVTMITKGRAAE